MNEHLSIEEIERGINENTTPKYYPPELTPEYLVKAEKARRLKVATILSRFQSLDTDEKQDMVYDLFKQLSESDSFLDMVEHYLYQHYPDSRQVQEQIAQPDFQARNCTKRSPLYNCLWWMADDKGVKRCRYGDGLIMAGPIVRDGVCEYYGEEW
jgi:hypothetical protein